jgi:membrane-associated phospholipid phosphatase
MSRATCREWVLVSMVCGAVAGLVDASMAADSSALSAPLDSIRAGNPVASAAVSIEKTGLARGGFLGRRDLWFALATAGALTLTAHNDRWLTQESTEADSRGEHRVASLAEPFGNSGYVLPGLVVAYGAARLLDHPGAASGILRVGESIVVAGAATVVIKEAVGRARPSESPDDPDTVRPFSGRSSFPSGHTAIGFAAATAIDRETSARWVPWVVYPAAGLIGWSRVHDRQHWTSDVAAGAALGVWAALETESVIRDRAAKHHMIGFELRPAIGGASEVGFAYRF